MSCTKSRITTRANKKARPWSSRKAKWNNNPSGKIMCGGRKRMAMLMHGKFFIVEDEGRERNSMFKDKVYTEKAAMHSIYTVHGSFFGVYVLMLFYGICSRSCSSGKTCTYRFKCALNAKRLISPLYLYFYSGGFDS